MQRREMLVGGGTVAAVALSGYTSAMTDQTDDDQISLSSDRKTILELIPADSALDTSYLRLQYFHIDDTAEENLDYQTRQILDDLADVDNEIGPNVVSDVVSVSPENSEFQLSVATGTFDRPQSNADSAETQDEWQIDDLGENKAFAGTDGRLSIVSATETEPTDIAETVVDTASGDTETVLVSPEATKPVFERLESAPYLIFFPDLETVEYLEFNEKIESFGVGFEQPPAERAGSGTVETQYVLELASDADVDNDWVRKRLGRIEQGEFIETTIERDDTFVHVEAVVDQPPERSREAAPEARIRARSNADDGVVTFEHVRGETIDTADLEVWVDGELAEEQLADEYDTFSEGNTFKLETGPIADVGLRWFDEDEDVYYYYVTRVVGSDLFEASHDPETDTVTITYDGELTADSDRLEVVHRKSDGIQNGQPTRPEQSSLEDRENVSGSLTQGETITVEDVTIGDRVSIELTTPANPNRGQRSLAHVRVRPPRIYLNRREDTLLARYQGDQKRDADEFRLLIDDEPADIQFTDVTDTLSKTDEIELGDVSHGSRVTVEWLEPDSEEPVVLEERVLRPHANIDLTYDDAEGTVVVEHREGDEIDADNLELRIDDEPAPDQPADDYETFEPGDDMNTDVNPFAMVELVWDEPEDTEYGLGRTIVGQESFDATYDPDTETVEFVYTGTQPADPTGLLIDHTDSESTRSDDGEALFSEQYDTLTTGDDVVVEDVGIDDRVTIMLVQEGPNYVSQQSIFWFTPEPRRAFAFEQQENSLVAVYHEKIDRDADNFEFLVDGEPADVQPADSYKTLTGGDEIELGEFEPGTEITVEWILPDDPREVTTHVVLPDTEFDIEYSPDDGDVTVTHAGGDEIDATDLGVLIEPTTLEPRGWDDYETVSEGDTTTIDIGSQDERDRDPIAVVIVYKGRNTISHKRIDD